MLARFRPIKLKRSRPGRCPTSARARWSAGSLQRVVARSAPTRPPTGDPADLSDALGTRKAGRVAARRAVASWTEGGPDPRAETLIPPRVPLDGLNRAQPLSPQMDVPGSASLARSIKDTIPDSSQSQYPPYDRTCSMELDRNDHRPALSGRVRLLSTRDQRGCGHRSGVR
jgi:hypothetical protein